MMTKFTMLINQGTADAGGNAKRTGGWSESLYSDKAIDSALLELDIVNMINLRAALLPTGASIIGERVQTVDPVGGSSSIGRVRPGSSGLPTDLPNMALLFKMRSAAGLNNRLFTLRGCPDSIIVTGEYKATPAYQAAIVSYFNEVRTNWFMKGVVKTNPTLHVKSVTAEGLVTTLEDHGLEAEQEVGFLRTRNAEGDLVKGVFKVQTIATANTFTIFNWANIGWGLINHGKVRAFAQDYFRLTISNDELQAPRAVTREVGAPFGQFVGRHSTAR